MNLFNCFQAMAFYTISPLIINWLFENGHQVWGYIMSVAMFIGYCVLSVHLHEKK